MNIIKSTSTAMTEKAGADFALKLKRGGVVALYGNLGAGKTAFVRGMVSRLCPDAYVTSPTFSIVNEYHGDVTVYHFDMYRVGSFEELYATGFFDYLGGDGICVIEWSENIENALPEHYYKVTISGEGGGERIITIDKV